MKFINNYTHMDKEINDKCSEFTGFIKKIQEKYRETEIRSINYSFENLYGAIDSFQKMIKLLISKHDLIQKIINSEEICIKILTIHCGKRGERGGHGEIINYDDVIVLLNDSPLSLLQKLNIIHNDVRHDYDVRVYIDLHINDKFVQNNQQTFAEIFSELLENHEMTEKNLKNGPISMEIECTIREQICH